MEAGGKVKGRSRRKEKVMPVNLDKPHRWKEDTARSVDYYNHWFMEFAPEAYRNQRVTATVEVEAALRLTSDLRDISPELLLAQPEVIGMLRMSTCPPLARDRLSGLSHVSPTLVYTMEDEKRVPPRMRKDELLEQLKRLGKTIHQLLDPDIFTWIGRRVQAKPEEVRRAASIVADRLCGAQANPIIKNAQEQRQLAEIARWLQARGYREASSRTAFDKLQAGTFGFRINVPALLESGATVNIPVDAVVKPRDARPSDLPFFVEAKSAGDFTNVNKRRKEEAAKMAQLRRTLGNSVRYVLFLCGYFDTGYLGYEASEGIDWVWEHRIDDFSEFGL